MGRQAIETFNENELEHADTINPFNKIANKTGVCPTMTTRPEGFKTAILAVTCNHRIRKLMPKESEGTLDTSCNQATLVKDKPVLVGGIGEKNFPSAYRQGQ